MKIRNQANHFEQQVEIGFLLRRNVDENRRAAPIFRHQPAIGELLLDPLGHGVGLINLVDGHDDGHFRGVSVIDGFDRLRHNAVIGAHDQHNDVGSLRTAGTHAGKRFVTRRIEENNLAAVGRRLLVDDSYLVSANVLGNAASFASCHVGQADGIEQGRLSVIDVAHDGDYRRTRHQLDGRVLAGCRIRNFFRCLLFEGDDVGIGAEKARHLTGKFRIQTLVDGSEHATRQQPSDQILCAKLKLLRQILNADTFRDRNCPRNRLRLVGERKPRRRSVALHRAFLHPTRNVTLTRPASRTSRTRSRSGCTRRR